MELEAFSYNKNVNKHINSIKYKDLELFNCVSSPITTAEVLQSYVKETEESKRKNKHIYRVFRLKQDNTNLLSSECAENLIKYLGTVHKLGIHELLVRYHQVNNGQVYGYSREIC